MNPKHDQNADSAPAVPFQLADGTGVLLRPVAGSDREYFRMAFRSLSPGSRYRRFFAAAPGLSDAQLRYLTEVDQLNHVAWVALAAKPTPAPALGVARLIRLPGQPAIAEFSLTVIDAMHRQGLGRALLAVLYLLAAQRGVETLRAICLLENQSVVSWLCRLGAESGGYSEGTLELDLHVETSPARYASRSSAAERFASVLDHLGRALAGAQEKLRSSGTLSPA